MRKQIKIVLSFVLFVFYILFLGGKGYAQQVSESPPITMPYGTGAQYYVYLGADKGLQINVQVWGQVLRPGMYSVPKTTDVVGLISFAGGPTKNANLGKVKLIRSGANPEVVIVDLNKYMKTGDKGFASILEPGNTIIIPENRAHKFSNIVGIISQIAIVANTASLCYLLWER